MAQWLVKEEPETYGYTQLEKDGKTVWAGVRNPLAQKHLRAIRKGDRIFYYHTGKEKAVVGIAKAWSDAYPDPAIPSGALFVVDIVPEKPLNHPVTLAAIKADKAFATFPLVRMSRLSVMPVTERVGTHRKNEPYRQLVGRPLPLSIRPDPQHETRLPVSRWTSPSIYETYSHRTARPPVATKLQDEASNQSRLQRFYGGEMSIFEAIGMAWVIFTSALASIAIVYLAVIGLRTVLNKQAEKEMTDSINVPIEVKEMFKIAR
jgi:predicted RNA-binding protein with PUA-like domain